MNLPIKSKKDWFIAFALTFLLIYALSGSHSQTYQKLLLSVGNFRLTTVNQPASYGNLIATVLIMTTLLAVLMTILRKRWKVVIQILLTGSLLSLVILGAYHLHCNLIVSVINTEVPSYISLSLNDRKTNFELTKEQEIRLVDLCSSLEPMKKQDAAFLKEQLKRSENNIYDGSLNIWISYGQKYGHYFSYRIHVVDDIIYIRKGYNYQDEELITICLDNGLLACLDEITATQ